MYTTNISQMDDSVCSRPDCRKQINNYRDTLNSQGDLLTFLRCTSGSPRTNFGLLMRLCAKTKILIFHSLMMSLIICQMINLWRNTNLYFIFISFIIWFTWVR